jgi:hypothetical protein
MAIIPRFNHANSVQIKLYSTKVKDDTLVVKYIKNGNIALFYYRYKICNYISSIICYIKLFVALIHMFSH